MTTYNILLRGVMPSGNNKVPMAQLRKVLAMAGFSNVRTYIQISNVLVDTEFSAIETENCIHHLIKEQIGPDLAVVVLMHTVCVLFNLQDQAPPLQLDRLVA